MSEVPHVINNIFSHLVSTLDPERDCETTYSFLPTATYVSLLSILPYLDFPEHLLKYLEIDHSQVFHDPDECEAFVESIPRLVRIEEESVIESSVKIYIHDNENEQRPHMFNCLGVEQEKISQHEKEIVSVLLHEWSKNKLKTQDIKFVQMLKRQSELNFLTIGNTFYFSAKWLYPFIESYTKISKFHIDTDFNVQVEMMELQHELRHCVHFDKEIACIELPLQVSHLSVLIFHPVNKDSDLFSMLKKMDPLFIDDCISLFEFSEVEVYLPKLKINDNVNLHNHLKRIDVFKDDCQDKQGFEIRDMTQAVNLTLNEYGISTKYSPKQSSRMETNRPAIPSCVHKINRPFIFMIYDSHYRCPMFVSTVFYPTRR